MYNKTNEKQIGQNDSQYVWIKKSTEWNGIYIEKKKKTKTKTNKQREKS